MWSKRRNHASPARDDQATQPLSEEPASTTFTGKSGVLELVRLHANVSLQVKDIAQITVTASGRQTRLDTLTASDYRGLRITGSHVPNESFIPGDTSDMLNTLHGLGFSFGEKRRQRFLAWLAKCQPVKLEITVPAGTDIWLDDFQGVVMAKGTLGNVAANASYGSTLTLDEIGSLKLWTGRDADVRVTSLNGSCEATLNQDSKLEVQGGVASSVALKLSAGCTANVLASSQSVAG